MARLAVSDKKEQDKRFLAFFPYIEKESVDERNYVKKAVNWALRQIGKRSRYLNAKAIEQARAIEQIDSRSAKWIARDALRELTNEAVQHMIADFVSAQQARRIDYCRSLRLSDTLIQDPPTARNEQDSAALYNLSVFRNCDWISLVLCARELPSFLQKRPIDATLGLNHAIRTHWVDDDTLCISPWPLNVRQLQVRTKGRSLPDGRYRSNADLLRVYEHAPSEDLQFTLTAPGSDDPPHLPA